MAGSRQIARSHGMISRRGLLRGIGAFAGAAAVGGVWESESIEIRRHKIFLPRWDANGFRVVQLTDLHANSPSQFRRAIQAVRMAIAEPADLIAITGDYLDYFNPMTKDHLIKMLAELNEAKCPVVAIYGNHDWGNLPIEEVTDLFKNSPAKILRNQFIEISGVSVAGIDDAMLGMASTDFLRNKHHSTSLLALWHEPDTILQTPHQVSLQLSGHSHGGEVCLPGGVPIHTPAMAKKFTGGFYGKTTVPLYVSKGIATVGPFRMYCPPEICVHTIYSSKNDQATLETA